MAKSHYHCAVLGDWHLAFNTAACISSLGHKTLLVNPLSNEEAKLWKEFPELQLNEPGLPEMISQSRTQGNLDYANGISGEWSADFVWLAIDTPVNDRDEADIRPLIKVAQEVSRFKSSAGPFVVSSQIPLGFCKKVKDEFGLTLVYVPENLRLGKGIETFKFADRTVVGSDTPAARESVKNLLKGFQTEFLLCDAVTSEMVKHATNAFLATSISFANEMARIGEIMGVDNITVGQALKMDKRIGKGAYVIPGLGFAGGTLPRDLRILQQLGNEHHTPTPLTNAVLDINESTAKALVRSVHDYLDGLQGKRILILGYTYKSDTDTLRRSPSIDLAKELIQGGAKVHGYDPMMNQRDLSSLEGLIHHHSSWDEISFLPDAIVIMTGRKDFLTVNWKRLTEFSKNGHKKPCLLLDTQNMIPAQLALDANLAYKGLWRPAIRPSP